MIKATAMEANGKHSRWREVFCSTLGADTKTHMNRGLYVLLKLMVFGSYITRYRYEPCYYVTMKKTFLVHSDLTNKKFTGS